jgi:hypothetical protein
MIQADAFVLRLFAANAPEIYPDMHQVSLAKTSLQIKQTELSNKK